MLEYTYQNFYEFIEANAKNAPKKTAIFIEDHKISYLKLKQSIDTFSRFLEFSGIQHQDRVAMIVGNSEDFLIALFAITKIGAIAVPLNTFLKKEEFEYILNDCGAKMLVGISRDFVVVVSVVGGHGSRRPTYRTLTRTHFRTTATPTLRQ